MADFEQLQEIRNVPEHEGSAYKLLARNREDGYERAFLLSVSNYAEVELLECLQDWFLGILAEVEAPLSKLFA